VAIMGGLIVATVLTLLALPAMYAAWFRVVRPEEHSRLHSRMHSELPDEA